MLEDRHIKIHGFFGLAVVPQKGSDFLHMKSPRFDFMLGSSPLARSLRLTTKLHPVCRNRRLTETMVAMRSKLIRQALACACLLFLLVPTVHSDTRPLPQDQGALHLAQLLTKL